MPCHWLSHTVPTTWRNQQDRLGSSRAYDSSIRPDTSETAAYFMDLLHTGHKQFYGRNGGSDL